MSRFQSSTIGALLIAAAAWSWSALGGSGEEQPKARTISADDLSSGKIVVIGRLGLPLRQMMTIRGTWDYPEQVPGRVLKIHELRFRVSHVDGKKLAKPLDFDKDLVQVTKIGDRNSLQPSQGEEWEFRGFETGSFRARPQQYYLETGGGAVSNRHAGFTSELEGFLPVPLKATQQAPQRIEKKSPR